MTARPETGLRLGDGGCSLLPAAALKAALERFDWFYTGAEFCENLLRGADWHEREVSLLLGKGRKVCVLTPPLSGRGLKALRPVLRRLAALARDTRAAGRMELTVNDFGTLELAAEAGLKVPFALGRLLYENMFFADRTKLMALNREAARLFASLGVRRFEFSTTGRLLATNLSGPGAPAFARDISVTLHYPYLNLTTARACAVGLPEIGPEDSVEAVRCRRECGLCAFEVRQPLIRETLLVKGNTVFLKFPGKFYASPAALARRRVDRLVYSPSP